MLQFSNLGYFPEVVWCFYLLRVGSDWAFSQHIYFSDNFVRAVALILRLSNILLALDNILCCCMRSAEVLCSFLIVLLSYVFSCFLLLCWP